MSDAPLLELSGVVKRYGAVVALADGQLRCERGTIHAIMGENGAGKSTLIKIIAGVVAPTEGTMRVDGAEVHFRGPEQAQARGIVCVFQELSLMADLSVADNIGITAPPRRFGMIDRREQRARASALLARVGCADIDPDERVRDLPLSRRQMVEIAKALGRNPRLLILDEGTSALTADDVARVVVLLKRLRDEGTCILYISHLMHEILGVGVHRVWGWQRLRDDVERALVASCVLGRFRINEAELAHHYGIGRTVARDVLVHIQASGILDKTERAHWVTVSLDDGRVRHLYALRALLETAALGEAASRIAPAQLRAVADTCPDVPPASLDALEHDLQVACLQHAENGELLAALRRTRCVIVSSKHLLGVDGALAGGDPFLAEHDAVLSALAANRPDAARRPLRQSPLRRAQGSGAIAAFSRERVPARASVHHPDPRYRHELAAEEPRPMSPLASRMPLRGTFPVVPTIFDEAGLLDLEGQRRAVDFMIDAGSDGLCILANWSEQFVLTDAERERLTRAILEHIAGRVPVIVTTTHFSSRVCAERSAQAEALGAAMVMVMPPYHGATIRVPEPAIAEFFRVVSDAIGIPVMIQDAPVSGTALSVPLLVNLAREIEQVRYFKIEVPQAAAKLRELIRLGGDAIEGPWDGEEAITLMADLEAGATGAMTGGGFPDGIRQIMDAWQSGDEQAAAASYARWLPLINFENRQTGLSAAKILMQAGGVIKCGMTRHPLMLPHPATQEGILRIARRLDPLVLRWAR